MVALTVIILSGCMSVPPAVPSNSAQQATTGIGWIRNEWRICTEGETCPKPTPKTMDVFPVQTAIQPPPSPPLASQKQIKAREDLRFVVHFDFGKATPTKDGMDELKKTLSRINDGDAIRIEGHTDDIGTVVFNDRLARKRAEFVAAWLKRHGVANPMEIEARGKCCYVAANDSDDGRAANRRVVVILKAVRGNPETISTTRKEIIK
jgi:outer membrane protein OmpA-like peptidoglycan-associated protein